MKKFVVIAALAVVCLCGSLAARAQQKSEWISKEFSNSPIAVAEIESFLNQSCQSSGLDGVQMFGVQNGHNSPMHVHLFCRPDKAAKVHYKVTVAPIPDRNPDKAAKPYIDDPSARIGPFYFGNTDQPDGVLIVQIVK